jgi:hypothetical protein|tara:strand:- start:1434 stop:1994 length:561 start_codon:yes stop_codon:yes gene_type:complete
MLTTTNSQASYTGDGSTTAFAFNNMFLAAGDLEVTLTIDATGVDTIKTITTHYTVAGAGVEAGGTVTMVAAPASGETLTVRRKTAQTQSTDYTANSSFPAASHETALDRVSMLAQELLTGYLADRGLNTDDLLKFHEKNADPANPGEGKSVIWQSNGSGSGDDGDIMIKITAGGVTKTKTIIDFSV